VSARIWGTPERGECVFDRPLQEGSVSSPNWLFRHDNWYKRFQSPSVIGNRVQGVTYLAGWKYGPNVVSYYATPPDVISVPGVPAAPFTDFPLT